MSSKTKRVLIMSIISVAYYIAFFTFRFIISEHIILYPANYRLSERCIIVHGQATTGPDIRVVQGAEYLLASIPLPHPEDLNVTEIKMTGKSIYNGILDYPDYYACDWLVYGAVVGTTDEYAICDSGTIPVFEAEKVYPLMSLSVFINSDMVLFLHFPVVFILSLFLHSWPFAAILIMLLKKKKQS